MDEKNLEKTKNENLNKELRESIGRLADTNERLLSIPYNFFLGVVRGVGIVIGTTIIAGILLTWLSRSIDTLADIPIVGPFIEQVDQEIDIPEDLE